ncbi:MAG: hypothetical protein IJO61_06940, partial [Oscillospiraceae bacterium]|nr:hypothetical protein [Oscillospiraceae bacterium]
FNTNEEYPVSDLLVDMLDSTSRAISKILGITDDEGEVIGEITVENLADKVHTAHIFYTNDESEDKWMQALFNERGIVCDEAFNKVAFTGTIGNKEYTIVVIVPLLL